MKPHDAHEYREDCPGCQIALCDAQGRKLPDDSPEAVLARKVWTETSIEDRRACNRVWVHGSQNQADLTAIARLAKAIKLRMETN